MVRRRELELGGVTSSLAASNHFHGLADGDVLRAQIDDVGHQAHAFLKLDDGRHYGVRPAAMSVGAAAD